MNLRHFLRLLLIIVATVTIFWASRITSDRPKLPFLAPDFTLQDLNGHSLRLSDFRGKAVVLNFWATWCPPCRAEIPWLIAMQKEYGPRGLQVVSVSMDETGRNDIQRFTRRNGINYPVLFGDAYVASLYGGVQVLPTTYYISRSGHVLAFASGVINFDEVELNIKEALGNR
jgi:thiol-disulfide isomerase/thioredoxin